MGKRKNLTKKQLAVIEDLFAGELDEQAILDKHKVSRNVYHKWLADERFAEQFAERIRQLYRQSQLILARCAPLAAAKLVGLTESEKEETARKACLDILSLPAAAGKNAVISTENAACTDPARQQSSPFEAGQLSPQTASRLLAALAEQKNDG